MGYLFKFVCIPSYSGPTLKISKLQIFSQFIIWGQSVANIESLSLNAVVTVLELSCFGTN